MKKCTQCGQILSDETKFCFKCGGANFEASADTGAAYQQPQQQSYYQQPAQQAPQQSYYQQPAYQTPPVSYNSSDETVSIGMNLLFLILTVIPIVNIIYAIVVTATSKKRSYRNLAIAWFICLGIGIVLSIVFGAVIYSTVMKLVGSVYGGFPNSFS